MPKEHIQRLRGVFQKLWEVGLKLKPSKCEFFKTRISYLGHVVLKDVIEVDPNNVEAIKKLASPKICYRCQKFPGIYQPLSSVHQEVHTNC